MYHRAWLQRASPSLQLLGPSEMQPPPPSHFGDEETGSARGKDLAKVTQEPEALGTLPASPCLRVPAPLAAEAVGSRYGPGRMGRSGLRQTRAATCPPVAEAGEAKGKKEVVG